VSCLHSLDQTVLNIREWAGRRKQTESAACPDRFWTRCIKPDRGACSLLVTGRSGSGSHDGPNCVETMQEVAKCLIQEARRVQTSRGASIWV